MNTLRSGFTHKRYRALVLAHAFLVWAALTPTESQAHSWDAITPPVDVQPAQVFSYRTPGTSADHRFSYEVELLKLVLDKTISEFGPYTLKPAPAMNLPRSMATARKDSEDTLVFKTSYSQSLAEEFNYPPYPIDRGIFSYRFCFVNNEAKEAVSQVRSISELRQFSIGQGVGWLDVAILQHNGFTVKESPGYEQLFPMLSAKRIDLVCRARNEVSVEWEHFSSLGGFSLNDSFALYYPLPRFYWVHKSRPEAFRRLNRGLEISYQDGSAYALWKKHYQQKQASAPLANRKIFVLNNPFLTGINRAYQQYFLDAQTKLQ